MSNETNTNAQTKKAPPPPPKATNAIATATAPGGHKFKMAFRKPDLAVGHRTLIYGKPGSGKTTMMLRGLPRPLVAFDFDNSINILLQKPQEESGIDATDIYLADVPRDKEGRLDYGAFLAFLRDPSNFEGVRSVLIDTGTFAEKAIEPYMFEHPDKYPTGNAKKQKATSLVDYAFRGGNIYKQDLYQVMLNYLDTLAVTHHIHIGIVYHTAVGKVPNLANADGYSLQYQPDSWIAGKTSLAETAMGWCDHVGAVKDDTVADGKDGKLQRVVSTVVQFRSDGEYIGKSRTLYGDAATVALGDFDLSMLGIR